MSMSMKMPLSKNIVSNHRGERRDHRVFKTVQPLFGFSDASAFSEGLCGNIKEND